MTKEFAMRVVMLSIGLSFLVAADVDAQESRAKPSSGKSSTRDPNDFFKSLANGKDVLTKSEMNPAMHWMFDRVADKLNIRDGRITRDQFQQYMDQKKGEGSGLPPASSTPSASNLDWNNPANLN